MKRIISNSVVLIIMAFLFVSSLHASDGTIKWSRIFGSSSIDDDGSVAVGPYGGIFVSGTTAGQFGGDTKVGSWDLCLTKFNSNGSNLWTRIWGSVFSDYAGSLDADNLGNAYVVGRAGTNVGDQINAGDFDLVLTKFNGSGGILWTRLLGSTLDDKCFDVAFHSSGNIYACGLTEGSFGGQVNSGGEDLLVVKSNSDGSNIWVKIVGSATDDYANAICVDSSENIYVGGNTLGGFGGQPALGADDACLIKYNAAGQVQWTRIFGTATNDDCWGVCVDNSGNIYAAGSTYGSVGGQINSGSADLFLTKFNSDGSSLWTRIWGSSDYDVGNDVCVGSDGNIYVTGYTWGEFGGQTNAGFSDLCLAKFDPDGNLLLSKIWGSAGPDSGKGVDGSSFENIYVAGNSYGSFGGQPQIGKTDLCLTRFRGPLPPNDNFADAIQIFGDTASVFGTNVNASSETDEPAHAGSAPNHSVWWKWTAPDNGELTVGTFGSDFDTVLAIYTGSYVDNLDLIAENDDVPPFGISGLTTNVMFGYQYKIAVDGGGGESGIIKLNIDFIPEPTTFLIFNFVFLICLRNFYFSIGKINRL